MIIVVDVVVIAFLEEFSIEYKGTYTVKLIMSISEPRVAIAA